MFKKFTVVVVLACLLPTGIVQAADWFLRRPAPPSAPMAGIGRQATAERPNAPPFGSARPRLNNWDWNQDARGNVRPTMNNRQWTTDARGNVRPTMNNREWTTDARGNVRPTMSNPGWTAR